MPRNAERRVVRLAGCIAVLLITGAFPVRAAQEEPLPDLDALYRDVRENLARAQRSFHLFAYKERRTDVHTNPFGRLGTDGTRTFEVYPSATPQLTYRRLIARNGVAVPANELAEQDQQYRARAADFERRARTQSADERRRLETESARARERAQRMIEDVVAALDFTMEGRSVYQGTPVVVIGFVPKPNARPATREGRIVQRFKGKAWIDEAAAEVIRIEATSFDNISFGFGIVARLGEGTVATLTRRPAAAGLWMPTELTLSGRGRAALFRRLVIDYSVEWFDYRRLPDDSLTPFLDAGVHGESGGRPE